MKIIGQNIFSVHLGRTHKRIRLELLLQIVGIKDNLIKIEGVLHLPCKQ